MTELYEFVKTGEITHYPNKCEELTPEAIEHEQKHFYDEFSGQAWCCGDVDFTTGICEKCGHQNRGMTEDILERRVNKKIVTVNIGDRSTNVNINLLNKKIDSWESIEGAIIDLAVEKLYGKCCGLRTNYGYPSNSYSCYGQIVNGYNCLTPIYGQIVNGYNCLTPIIYCDILS